MVRVETSGTQGPYYYDGVCVKWMLTGPPCCAAGKFSCFGELMSQPSRLAPNAAMDATVGQLIADGLATSATVLVSNLLRTAAKCALALVLLCMYD